MNRWKRAAQRGAGMVEYALIMVLVSLTAMAVLISLGGAIKHVLSNVSKAL